MDLQERYDELVLRFGRIGSELEKLERSGKYGTAEYDKLVDEEMEVSLELDALEEEIDR